MQEKRGTKHKLDKQKINSKMIDLIQTISIFTLNANNLNTPTKRQRWSDFKKQELTTVLSVRKTF